MANFPIENFYTGYHVTSGLYSTGYADGSLQAQLQQTFGGAPSAQVCNTPYWQSVMTTQQNLFTGWNGFCGCSQPQPPQTGQCGRQRVDIDVYHHFYEGGCGGPFTCNHGQGATSTSQSYGAFGAHGACHSWQNSSCNAFNSYLNFGFGRNGLYGCPPRPTGYQGAYGTGYGGYQGSYGTNYGGSQGSYGTNYGGYQGSYGGGYDGYQGCYGGGYGGYQGSYGGGYGGYQGGYGGGSTGGYQGSYGTGTQGCNNNYGLPQNLPSYNWGDFNFSFGGCKDNAFGVLPSSYASYAMTSPFTDFGTAAGIAALGGALSLLF